MTERTPPQGGARKLPLDGFKVIELGHYIAGPFAARLLADMGAEVIKIEPPEGDPHRGWGSQVDGHAVWFSIHGRNKTCITLDLKSAEGREKVKALAARADALIENFRPGYLERIGLGPDVLQAINPKLTIARVSGYGQDGPYRDKPAFGSIGEAMGGIRHLTATPGVTDHPPPRCGVSIADDVAGIYAAMAVLGAAWATKADPAAKGRVIDVDLVGSIFSLMEGMLPEYGLFGWVRQPQGAALPTAAPTNTYLCADGKWLCVGGNSDAIYKRLMKAVGREDLGEDPRMATNIGRCANVKEIDAAIGAWTRTLPAAEAERILEGVEVPVSRLSDIKDCAEDPHFRARQTVMEVDDPLIGKILHPAPPFRFDGVSPAEMVRWTAPAIGAHNDHVFHELLGEEPKA
jgi:formyl-CoA transferase